MITRRGKVPVRWWNNSPNFGDQLAPWLVSKITGLETFYSRGENPHYMVIGSIVKRARPNSVVWGPGLFGMEGRKHLEPEATYLAVRGPLTRNKLLLHGIEVPRIYGDPALLVSEFHRPKAAPTHEVGVVLRWSEDDWETGFDVEGVKKIYLKSDDIEGVLDAMLDCKRIVSSSLHGLIIADAYGIPNAWLRSDTPTGKEFKFYDYFTSVGKVQHSQEFDLLQPGLTEKRILDELFFNDAPIRIDLDLLKSVCPFGYDGVATA